MTPIHTVFCASVKGPLKRGAVSAALSRKERRFPGTCISNTTPWSMQAGRPASSLGPSSECLSIPRQSASVAVVDCDRHRERVVRASPKIQVPSAELVYQPVSPWYHGRKILVLCCGLSAGRLLIPVPMNAILVPAMVGTNNPAAL